MIRKVTYATLIFTDGTNQVYGVFRGKLYRPRAPHQSWWFGLGAAKQIASIKTQATPDVFNYFAAAAQYATPDFPAFDWKTTKGGSNEHVQRIPD